MMRKFTTGGQVRKVSLESAIILRARPAPAVSSGPPIGALLAGVRVRDLRFAWAQTTTVLPFGERVFCSDNSSCFVDDFEMAARPT